MAEQPATPVDFQKTLAYIYKVKAHFSANPELYDEFLDTLKSFHAEPPTPVHDVHARVAQLLEGAPELLAEFREYLPNMESQGGGGGGVVQGGEGVEGERVGAAENTREVVKAVGERSGHRSRL